MDKVTGMLPFDVSKLTKPKDEEEEKVILWKARYCSPTKGERRKERTQRKDARRRTGYCSTSDWKS